MPVPTFTVAVVFLAMAIPYICYYGLAAYVARRDPSALKHLPGMHPRSFQRRGGPRDKDIQRHRRRP